MNTSVKKIPATFKMVDWKPNTTLIDIGCGRYFELYKDALESKGVMAFGYDCNWCPDWFNGEVLDRKVKPDYITCNNVLNVIESKHDQLELLQSIVCLSEPKTDIYFLIYEGNKSGVGIKTGRGYQHNKRSVDYLSFLNGYFPNVCLKKNLIHCRRG
jgi:hypothetical protein